MAHIGTQGLCGPKQIECASSKGLFDGHFRHQLGHTVSCQPRSASRAHMHHPVGHAVLTRINAIDRCSQVADEEWVASVCSLTLLQKLAPRPAVPVTPEVLSVLTLRMLRELTQPNVSFMQPQP